MSLMIGLLMTMIGAGQDSPLYKAGDETNYAISGTMIEKSPFTAILTTACTKAGSPKGAVITIGMSDVGGDPSSGVQSVPKRNLTLDVHGMPVAMKLSGSDQLELFFLLAASRNAEVKNAGDSSMWDFNIGKDAYSFHVTTKRVDDDAKGNPTNDVVGTISYDGGQLGTIHCVSSFDAKDALLASGTCDVKIGPTVMHLVFKRER